MNIFAVLKKAGKLVREERKQKLAIDKKARIAKLFNERYLYYNNYFSKETARFSATVNDRNAWMCPDCNMIHRPIGHNGLTGLQYPACCKTVKGHRINAIDK